MKKPEKYYSMQIDKNNKVADITIFGEITSWPWLESDVSSYKLSKRLEELKGIEEINVHINSYGGEVSEGWAIYNALLNHSARVNTIVDGFACSIASVIFMAGEKRIMNQISTLMIHNAWTFVGGDMNQIRKQADDLEIINNLSKQVYLNHVNISDVELQQMLDVETYVTSENALKFGFATEIKNETTKNVSQSAKKSIIQKLISNKLTSNSLLYNMEEGDDDLKKYECDECGYIHEGELPEYFVCPECGASKDSFIELFDNEGQDEDEPIDVETSEEVEEPSTETSATSKTDNQGDDDTVNQRAYRFFNAIAKEGRDK